MQVDSADLVPGDVIVLAAGDRVPADCRLIDYTPAGQYLFGTAAISLDVWLFVLPFAVAMMSIEETRKCVARTTRQPTGSPQPQTE